MSHDVTLRPINKVTLEPTPTVIMKKSDARINYECLSPVVESPTARPKSLTKVKKSKFKRNPVATNSSMAVSTFTSIAPQITLGLNDSVRQFKL